MFVKQLIPFILFILCCCKVFSQSFVTKFVEDKKIQWAGYLIDSAHFSDPNLSLLLRKRFERGEIKAFRPLYPGLQEAGLNRNSIGFSSKEKFFEHEEDLVLPFYDEDGNMVERPARKTFDLFDAKKFDQWTNDLIEFEQVLYVESGRLKNFISSMSPKFSVITPQGTYLGMGNLFSTGLNTEKNIKKRTRKKALALGSTNTRYTLKDSGIIQLKQLYGRHLLEALWPYFGKAGYEITRINSSQKISFKELSVTDLGYEDLHVPLYDAEGNMRKELGLGSPIDASIFSSVSITREWLYSKEKNILICNIPSITLYYAKKDNLSGNVTETPVIKINMR